MTAITALSQDFEGTDGATAIAAAIGASSILGGGAAAYSAADPQQGTTCLQCTSGAGTNVNIRYDFTAVSLLWFNFYFKTPSAAPAANTTHASWAGNAGVNAGGNFRILTDMTAQLRDNNTSRYITNISGTPTALPTNTWCRGAIRAQPGSATGHQLKIYVGTNRHGTVADFDSGGVTATGGPATNIDTLHIGIINNGVTSIFLDRMRADDASEPAGLAVGGPPTVNCGPDLTKVFGSSPFTIHAAITPAAGDSISSVSFSVLSGLALTLTNPNTDTVTVTPPTGAGTSVIRNHVVMTSGQTKDTDVTITWVAAGVRLHPAADVSNPGGFTGLGGTTPLYPLIGEDVLNTATGVASPQSATAAVMTTRLEGMAAPTSTTGWRLTVNGYKMPDASTQSDAFALYESDGTTLRKAWAAITDFSTTDSERQLTLTAGEVAAITSWLSGLILKRTTTVT